MKVTQKQRVLRHLESGKALSRLDGWDLLGILELPARICELKQQGHNIKTTMTSVNNRYGETVKVASWRLIK